MGARTVAGETFTLPILKDEGKTRAAVGTDDGTDDGATGVSPVPVAEGAGLSQNFCTL
jgi:hypothetical protein